MNFSLESLQHALRSYITHSTRPDEADREFRHHINQVFATVLQILLVALLLLILGSWPAEYFLFENPTVFYWFSLWRFVVIPVVVLFLLAMRDSAWARKHANKIMLVGAPPCLFWVGYCLAEATLSTPHRSPWFFTAYVIPFFSTPMALRFAKRVLASVAFPATFLFGYFLSRPTYLTEPYLFSSLIIVLGTTVISLTLGHIIFHLNRVNFFKEQKLEYLASHDKLTGLFSRREFEHRLETTLREASRYNFPVSLLMIDLDHFKTINDTHGHSAGDRVLERFGTILQTQIRDPDVAGRYGGEEFAVILPHTPIKKARNLADRIRRSLKEEQFEANRDTFQATCSIGVAQFEGDTENKDELIKRTDRALYGAKESGRDRVEDSASLEDEVPASPDEPGND